MFVNSQISLGVLTWLGVLFEAQDGHFGDPVPGVFHTEPLVGSTMRSVII